MPFCDVCGRRKKPQGRDSRDAGLCDHECDGYYEGEIAGHLWPGEGPESAETERASATPPVAGAMNGERSKNNSLRAGRSDGMMTG